MSIPTGRELEFLASLRTNWRRLYLSEVARLLKEDDTGGDQPMPFHRPATQTWQRLHSELGVQILENKAEALKLADQMRHVEAVIKMLDPSFNLRRIAVKRGRAVAFAP